MRKEIDKRPIWASGICLGVLLGTVIFLLIQATEIAVIPAFTLWNKVITLSQFIPSIPFSFVAVFWQMAKYWKRD